MKDNDDTVWRASTHVVAYSRTMKAQLALTAVLILATTLAMPPGTPLSTLRARHGNLPESVVDSKPFVVFEDAEGCWHEVATRGRTVAAVAMRRQP
jgi:hypothetical protein